VVVKHIKLCSLEKDLQTKYIQDFYVDFENANNEIIELKNLNIKQEKLISESQKKMVLAKYDLVFLWLDFRKSFKSDKLKTSKNTPDNEFLNLYNTGITKKFLKFYVLSQSVLFIVGGP